MSIPLESLVAAYDSQACSVECQQTAHSDEQQKTLLWLAVKAAKRHPIGHALFYLRYVGFSQQHYALIENYLAAHVAMGLGHAHLKTQHKQQLEQSVSDFISAFTQLIDEEHRT
ncbi:hypothetical protein RCJ22_18775 [Vibrio sp. FNV 38]|nr:hypothetical protein [Vibrio sp. FNV 38]